MASSPATKSYSFALCRLLGVLFLSSNLVFVSGFRFKVGGHRGWVKPTGDERETYNEWAEQHRFHIGDTLYFKYHKDSVLEVSKEGYQDCNRTNPIARFHDGHTVFMFNHSKFFYFISGEPGHCEAGQRLIVRVMVQSGFHWISISPTPSPSPSPATGYDGDGGKADDRSYLGPSHTASSAELLPVVPFVVSSLAALAVLLYQFIV